VIFARPWPATFDRTALRTLCSMIAAWFSAFGKILCWCSLIGRTKTLFPWRKCDVSRWLSTLNCPLRSKNETGNLVPWSTSHRFPMAQIWSTAEGQLKILVIYICPDIECH
jgi:hypothetical protein